MDKDPTTYEEAMQLVYRLRDQLQALTTERDLANDDRDVAQRKLAECEQVQRALSESMGGGS